MRYMALLGLLAVIGCGRLADKNLPPAQKQTQEDAKKPLEQLRKERDEARATAVAAETRADSLQKIIDQKETYQWQSRARWAAAGFLALAVLCLVACFYLPVAKKTMLVAAVCLGLLGGACLVFAWLIPYLLPIGIALAVILAGVGVYLVKADANKRQEAFAIASRVAAKLGAEGEAATRKSLLFLEELANAKILNRQEMKEMAERVAPVSPVG